MAGMAYTPVQNGERSPYGGGGGKMRSRRAPKRNGTPYDRPATGRHASAGPQAAALMNTNGGAGAGDAAKRDGWLGSRLLGTASKIVTSSASYLYSSIFKRPAGGGGVLLLNDAEKPAVDNIEGHTDMLSPSAAEAESMEAGSQHGEEDKTTSEVESWMKRTFPREEADRLIASLRSYVKENGTAAEHVDNVIKEEQRRSALVNQVPALESAPSNGQLSDAQRWREERTKARQEQKSNLWPGGSGKENGTPPEAGTSEAGEIVVVDVARAYMGERATRMVTPDRARVTLTREKVPTPLRVSPYQPSPYLLRKHQGTSFSTQFESASPATPFSLPAPGGVRKRDEALDENLRTPPVSRTVGRLLPVSRTNVPSSAIGYPMPGEGSKKRGSAVLEDGGYSSGGPIRRLRPRSSLYTPSPASGLQRRGGLGMYPPPPRILQTPVDIKQKPITMWSRNVDTGEKVNVLNAQQQKEEPRTPTIGASASVPPQSSATARKILETLDRMTPSPKEKSLDTELALVRERPPTELTTSMINDKARRTMQSWDFPGPLESEEAGPSGRGRNLESDLSTAAGFSWKGAEQGTRARGKGKAPASTPSHTMEEKTADHPPFSFQDTARLKVSESSLANSSPAFGRNKGFQINADFDDSDEESRGASANLLATSVPSTTSFMTGKNAPPGAGPFDNSSSRSLNVTAPIFGAPVLVDSQRTTTESNDGKSNIASGGFTFPSSNPFGTLEPPPTPKPFPSLANAGSTAKPNGLPNYKFDSGAQVFKLPSTGTGGADIAQSGDMKSNHQLDSEPDSLPSDVSLHDTSQSFPTNPVESTKGDTPTLGSSGAEISIQPSTSTTFTSSTFSLANFGAPGAGAKPGVFNSQTVSSPPGNSTPEVTTSAFTSETSLFNFGKTPSSSPSLEPATSAPASTGTGTNLFGNNGTSSGASTTSSGFGSSSTFGTNKSSFPFGTAANSSSSTPLQSTAPSATSDDGNRPQKRMFGQEQASTGDGSAATSTTVSFGLSAPAPSATSGSAGSTFTVSAFGQDTSSSAPASNSTSLFGLKPSSIDSTPSTSSASSPSSGTAAFGTTSTAFGSSTLFGSSAFGSGNNVTPSFGGASSTPAFGASSTPAFGASSTPAFGASSTPAFGASSAPSFGASTTPAFGASSTPAFGASSTPAFGGSSTPAFGASSTPAFGGSSTPAFGASSAPAFGASSTPAFGASSTPAFGTSSTPAFGASSTPAFGASSTPSFGVSSAPSFGASSAPAFGASSTPSFGASNANSKPFGGFNTEVSTQPSQSPSLFAGFGTPANSASVSSPTTFSFGANAGSTTFSFGASSAASPTTSTGAFAFGASSAASPASPFNFGAKPTSPMFGTGSTAPTFGSSPNGGMGTDMEDTMADDGQMMASSPPPQQQPSLFGAPQTPGSSPFPFGNTATQVATPSPVFGGFGNTGPPAGANPFAASPQQTTPVANPFAASPQQGQPLNFGGGGFALGSSGQEQGAKPTGRKYIKAKRASSVKRK